MESRFARSNRYYCVEKLIQLIQTLAFVLLSLRFLILNKRDEVGAEVNS